MKAIIEIDIPDDKIGEEVTIYFPDSTMKHGVCRELKTLKARFCHPAVLYGTIPETWIRNDLASRIAKTMQEEGLINYVTTSAGYSETSTSLPEIDAYVKVLEWNK